MEDLAPILVAICGFAIVCVGVITLAAFIFAKILGAKVPFIFKMLGGSDDSDNLEEESVLPRRRAPLRSTRDLQNKAQNLDFDSAVDKYRQKFDRTSPDPKVIPTTLPSDTTLTDYVSQTPDVGKPKFPRDRRDRRWGRVDSNAHDDEVLGGIFGEEDYDDEGGLF